MNLKSLASTFKESLHGVYSADESESIFLLVIEHFLNLKRSDFILNKDKEVNTEDFHHIERTLVELQKGKPVQYIIGETHFYGLLFKVTPAVLIPRPETEELVEWVIETVEQGPHATSVNNSKSILDIGTGSGCIAISLKKNLPFYEVDALDIAAESLAIAKQNAILNDVEVNWRQEDILQPSVQSIRQYSVIVSNPPYIKMDEQSEMHANVLDFEPHRALFVEDDDPLMFYKAIMDFAQQYLLPNGWLFFEINEYLGKEMLALAADKGFAEVELKKDMQDKNRMLRCRKINGLKNVDDIV